MNLTCSSVTFVLANTVKTSAIPPLVIQILDPFNTYLVPSGEREAVVCMEAASLPLKPKRTDYIWIMGMIMRSYPWIFSYNRCAVESLWTIRKSVSCNYTPLMNSYLYLLSMLNTHTWRVQWDKKLPASHHWQEKAGISVSAPRFLLLEYPTIKQKNSLTISAYLQPAICKTVWITLRPIAWWAASVTLSAPSLPVNSAILAYLVAFRFNPPVNDQRIWKKWESSIPVC